MATIQDYPLLVEQWDENNEKSIDSIKLNTNYKALWKCKEGHNWKAKPSDRIQRNKEGISSCPICTGRVLSPGVNDIVTLFPEVASTWNYEKNTGNPEDYSFASTKKVWWKCSIDAYEWIATVNARCKSGTGCPSCAGKVIISGVNDIFTNYPELQKEWDSSNSLLPQEISAESTKKVSWICPNDHSYELEPWKRTKRGFGCNYCEDRSFKSGINDLLTKRPELAAKYSSQNKIPASEIFYISRKPLLWDCPEGHTYKTTIPWMLKGVPCNICSCKVFIKGINDLETMNPEFFSEWDYDRNDKLPSDISYKSKHFAYWLCNKENHSYQCSVHDRARGIGCPYCSGRRRTVKNSLLTLYPKIAAELHPEERKTAAELAPGSHYKALWQCPQEPSHSWTATVKNRIGRNSGCPSCISFVSHAEQEVADFIVSLLPGEPVVTSDRSVIHPKELDIYIPSRNLAVEFNGLYWHSEAAGKGRNYHREKWEACRDAGIQLIQVWEDEWRDKKEIVQSMLAHKLGVSQGKHVFARKTEVSSILKAEAEEFLNKYHIQGFVSGSYYLGLRPKGSSDLVSVMVLRKNGNLLYLDRYATNCSVVGGQGKLLSWAHENIDFSELVTFADLQVSDGGLYEATGWVKDSYLRPDYRYLVNGERIHKFNYRLNRFRTDTALDFEEGKSERELAELNGIPRVWDTGKIRYVMPRKS